MSRSRVRIAVSFEIPEGASKEECLTYVVDAVTTMCGSYNPDTDPMFNLERESIQASMAIFRNNKRQIVRCNYEDL